MHATNLANEFSPTSASPADFIESNSGTKLYINPRLVPLGHLALKNMWSFALRHLRRNLVFICQESVQFSSTYLTTVTSTMKPLSSWRLWIFEHFSFYGNFCICLLNTCPHTLWQLLISCCRLCGRSCSNYLCKQQLCYTCCVLCNLTHHTFVACSFDNIFIFRACLDIYCCQLTTAIKYVAKTQRYILGLLPDRWLLVNAAVIALSNVTLIISSHFPFSLTHLANNVATLSAIFVSSNYAALLLHYYRWWFFLLLPATRQLLL